MLFSHGLLFSVGCMLETSGTAQSSCTCIEGGKPLLGSNSRRVHLEILPCFTFQRSYLPPGITRSKPTVRLEDPPVADSCRRPTNAGKNAAKLSIRGKMQTRLRLSTLVGWCRSSGGIDAPNLGKAQGFKRSHHKEKQQWSS